jgi:hypothetical protein
MKVSMVGHRYATRARARDAGGGQHGSCRTHTYTHSHTGHTGPEEPRLTRRYAKGQEDLCSNGNFPDGLGSSTSSARP